MDQQELLIASELKKGNHLAYKYLYTHHFQVMCRVAYKFTGDEFIAESISQDIICHIWENRERLNIRYSLRSYLLTAVRNRCINYLASSTGISEKSFSRLGDSEKGGLTGILSESAEPMTEKDMMLAARHALAKMGKETRNAFRKSRMEEKSYDEIAEELGISVNTVKYHIKTAIRLLRAEFSE